MINYCFNCFAVDVLSVGVIGCSDVLLDQHCMLRTLT